MRTVLTKRYVSMRPCCYAYRGIRKPPCFAPTLEGAVRVADPCTNVPAILQGSKTKHQKSGRSAALFLWRWRDMSGDESGDESRQRPGTCAASVSCTRISARQAWPPEATLTTLFLKTLQGLTLSVRVAEDDTVAALKRRIEALHGFAAGTQRLIYGGKVLADCDTVGDCELYEDTTVHLVVGDGDRDRGKGGGGGASAEQRDLQPPEAQGASAANIVLVGVTGSGKSALASLIVRAVGGNDDDVLEFASSDGPDACTRQVVARVVSTTFGAVRVIDTPGLMDADGPVKDEEHIRVIVRHVKELGHVSALVLVVNEQCSRVDRPLVNTVKLFVDSFGDAVLRNLAVVYTRASGLRTRHDARVATDALCAHVSARTGFDRCADGGADVRGNGGPSRSVQSALSHLLREVEMEDASSLHVPCFQVDCFPQLLRMYGAAPAHIARVHAQTLLEVEDLLRFATNTTAVSTQDATYGVPAETRVARAVKDQQRRRRGQGSCCLSFNRPFYQ
jgi:hypothetical protein